MLADKPNFEFEFRDSLQFKNVPEPVKCYYLLANTALDLASASMVVDDEPEQMYQFMIPRSTDTPPATPLLSGTLGYEGDPNPANSNLSQFVSNMPDGGKGGCPMFKGAVPDFNVIKPTPTSTPNPSPPTSPPKTCPAHSHSTPPTTSSPSPPISTTTILINSPPPDSEPPQGFDVPPVHHHPPTAFMATMRNTSMTPLTEDANEEMNGTAPNADEGIEIPQRKLSDGSNCSAGSGIDFSVHESSSTVSDMGGAVSKPPTRKISDVSSHSGESGIESTTSKVSDTSKDGLVEYKLSNDSKEDRGSTSRDVVDREATPKEELSPERQLEERRLSGSSSGSTEEELTFLRSRRAGSVHKTIEKYDSLTRQRKSGLPMVSQSPGPGRGGSVNTNASSAGTQHNGEAEEGGAKWHGSEHSSTVST